MPERPHFQVCHKTLKPDFLIPSPYTERFQGHVAREVASRFLAFRIALEVLSNGLPKRGAFGKLCCTGVEAFGQYSALCTFRQCTRLACRHLDVEESWDGCGKLQLEYAFKQSG